MGFNKAEEQRTDSFIDMMIQIASSKNNKEELKTVFQESMTDWMKQQPDSVLLKMGIKGVNGDDNIRSVADTFFSSWMRYFTKYDPAPVLTKIRVPFLALNGGKDVQVRAKENLAGFDQLLKQAGNKDFKIVMLPNLNHLFQNAETGMVNEYEAIEETISPEVLAIITDWILKIK